jgi:hypothetical protein
MSPSRFSFLSIAVMFLSVVGLAEVNRANTSSAKATSSQSRSAISSSLRTNTIKSKNGSGSTSALASATGLESLYGYLEFRPSYTTKVGEIHTENTADVGLKIMPTMKAGYLQWFSTNLISNLPTTQGLNLTANDGFFYFKAKDILKSKDEKWIAAYQLRLLTPTDSTKVKAGYLTTIRNQFQISYKYNDFIKTDLEYRPMVHVYNRASVQGSDGTVASNPAFDHQFVLNQEIHPAEKLTLYLPVVYQITTFRQEAGAANSGRWKKLMIFLPELDYEINPMHTIGISYYTDNLISAYGSGLNLSSGFEKGVVQLVWGINL